LVIARGQLWTYVRDGSLSSPLAPLFKLSGPSQYSWRGKFRAAAYAEVIP